MILVTRCRQAGIGIGTVTEKMETMNTISSVLGVLDIPVGWEEWDLYEFGNTLPAGRYRSKRHRV